MLIKNGVKYYEEADLREYGRGYWAGRFEGYLDTKHKSTAYMMGYTHGEADYNTYDADFTADPVFDDLDVVEQLQAHANIDPRKVSRYNK